MMFDRQGRHIVSVLPASLDKALVITTIITIIIGGHDDEAPLHLACIQCPQQQAKLWLCLYLLSGKAHSDVCAIVTSSGHNTRSKEFVP